MNEKTKRVVFFVVLVGVCVGLPIGIAVVGAVSALCAMLPFLLFCLVGIFVLVHFRREFAAATVGTPFEEAATDWNGFFARRGEEADKEESDPYDTKAEFDRRADSPRARRNQPSEASFWSSMFDESEDGDEDDDIDPEEWLAKAISQASDIIAIMISFGESPVIMTGTNLAELEKRVAVEPGQIVVSEAQWLEFVDYWNDGHRPKPEAPVNPALSAMKRMVSELITEFGPHAVLRALISLELPAEEAEAPARPDLAEQPPVDPPAHPDFYVPPAPEQPAVESVSEAEGPNGRWDTDDEWRGSGEDGGLVAHGSTNE